MGKGTGVGEGTGASHASEDVIQRASPRPTARWQVAIFGCGGVLLGTLTAIAAIDARAEYVTLLVLVGIAALAYLTALWLTARGPRRSRRDLTLCLLLALAWRVPLLMSAPLLSDDIYRYVWDGRVQRLGYNPFTTVPADPALAHLQTDVTRQIDPTNAALPTIYPPAAQLFFRAVMTVHESVGALLLATLVCDGLIVLILLKWLTATGRSPWRVLAYAWHPLVAIEGAGGGHVDMLGVLCVLATAWLLTRRRTGVAAVTFVVAVAVKFLPVVLAPLLWKRIRLRDAALAAAVGFALYLPFTSVDTGIPFGSLGTYTEKWRFNGPLFSGLEPALGIVGVLGLAAAAGLAVAGVLRWRFDVSEPGAWAWPIAATALLMPAVYPWYLLWMTPFLTVLPAAPLTAWTLTSLLTYVVWGPELSGGAWVLPGWVMPVEYGIVAAVAIVAMLVHRWRIAGRPAVEPAPLDPSL